jgi:hypothetical protein
MALCRKSVATGSASWLFRAVAGGQRRHRGLAQAQELCEQLEREAAADEGMSLEQYCQKIEPGMTAMREAMCKDHDIAVLREKLVKDLNRDAARQSNSAATPRGVGEVEDEA